MVVLAQLVRASVCGTEGRGFEPHIPPQVLRSSLKRLLFLFAGISETQKGHNVLQPQMPKVGSIPIVGIKRNCWGNEIRDQFNRRSLA